MSHWTWRPLKTGWHWQALRNEQTGAWLIKTKDIDSGTLSAWEEQEKARTESPEDFEGEYPQFQWFKAFELPEPPTKGEGVRP